MAESRLISRSLTGSRKFNGDISDRARVLYCMTLSYTDDFGLFHGSAWDLRTYIVPNLRWSLKTVEKCRDELVAIKLWKYWEVGGQEVIEITGFEKNQTGLHKRTRAKFPDPSGKFREAHGKPGKPPPPSGGKPRAPVPLSQMEG